MYAIRSAFIVLFLSFAMTPVHAFQPASSASESVMSGVRAVLDIVRKYEGNGDEDARRQYLDEVGQVLEPVIGYSVIARRVMGDAYNDATREQKIRFLDAFKRSLVNTYAGGIYSFGGFDVNLLPSQDDKKDTLRNTRVFMDVISPEGPKYSLVQSVYYSQTTEGWKMQNAIFNGINIGVTFRSQFEQIYRESSQDMDKTIVEWEKITEEAFNNTKFRD